MAASTETAGDIIANADLKEISDKIKNGTYSLKNHSSKRSDAWKIFRLVLDENDAEVHGVACCEQCYLCLWYKKKSGGKIVDYGTKNLLGHINNCKKSGPGSSRQSSLHSHFIPPQSVKISSKTAEAVKKAEIKFVNATFSPFAIVDNPRFLALMDQMIEIGATYGKVQARDIIYGRKTIQKGTLSCLEFLQAKIRHEIKFPASRGCVSFVTDMWSDNVIQNSYLEITLFWCEQSGDDLTEWKLKRAMFQCWHFPASKTAEKVEAGINRALVAAGLNPNQLAVTTDKGANIVAATMQKLQVDCACHRLHTAIQTAWENSKMLSSSLQDLDDNCMRLVTFVKKSTGIQSQLPITLKKGGKTRPWRALIKMFSSILSNANDEDQSLAHALLSWKKEGYLTDIDFELLQSVYSVVEIAGQIFDTLEAAKNPTLPYVLPGYYTLRNRWDGQHPADSTEIRTLKSQLVIAIDDKLWTSIISLHFAATFLDLSLRDFLFCPVQLDRNMFKDTALSCLKQYCVSHNQQAEGGSPTQEEPTTTTLSPDIPTTSTAYRPPRRDVFAAFRTSAVSRPEDGSSTNPTYDFEYAFCQEIERYGMLPGPDMHENFDPLPWWGKQRFRFPLLSVAANQILTVQGSSSESERHFSTGGKITRKDRARLSSKTVEAQVMVAEAIKGGFY